MTCSLLLFLPAYIPPVHTKLYPRTQCSKPFNRTTWESFKKLYDLYSEYFEPDKFPGGRVSAQTMLQYDASEILDEFIKRTGWGLDLPAPPEEEVKKKQAEQESKLHLGIKVNGKKRKDLATMGQPTGVELTRDTTPPLWQAVSCDARKIVAYFGTGRPLEAYQSFAETFNRTRYPCQGNA